jgi:Flp pilus assembly protein TadB
MRLVRYLGLLYAALAALGIARNAWGQMGEVIVAGGVLLVGAVSWFVLWRRDRATRRELAALPLDQQIQAIKADPEIRDLAAGDVLGNERRDRNWHLARILGPWLAILYLPTLYLIVANRHENGLVVMALVVVGMGSWGWWMRRYVRDYRCPTCGARHLPAVSLRPLRYVCLRCATTWRL